MRQSSGHPHGDGPQPGHRCADAQRNRHCAKMNQRYADHGVVAVGAAGRGVAPSSDAANTAVAAGLMRCSGNLVIRMRSRRSASEMPCGASPQPVPSMSYLYSLPMCYVQFVRHLYCLCGLFNSRATHLHRYMILLPETNVIARVRQFERNRVVASSDPTLTSAGHLGAIAFRLSWASAGIPSLPIGALDTNPIGLGI